MRTLPSPISARVRSTSRFEPMEVRRAHRSRQATLVLILVSIMLIMVSPGEIVVGAPALQATETTICTLQAHGGPSPLVDTMVTAEGIVTSDFIDTDIGGFFMQAPGCDEDAGTSDGVLVFTFRDTEISVAPGDRVRVTGEVREYYDMTEIFVDATGSFEKLSEAAVPEPILLDIPAEPAEAMSYLESHEGMLVALPPAFVVGATNAHGEPYVVPANAGIERLFRLNPDGRRLGLMFPWGWQVLDHADVVGGLVGALNYTFENYKLTVAGDAELEITPSGSEPPISAPAAPGEITLATYNVENFFDTIDDEGKNDTEWTLSEEDYAIAVSRRARSIRDSLGSPDLIGFQEVETIRALSDLAAHEHLADAGYEALLVDGPDGRGIDVGFLFRRERLSLVTHAARQKCLADKPFGDGPGGTCDLPEGGEGFPLFSRPPLVATFDVIGTDGRMSVIVNHFKSKRGGDEGTTPVRTAMAKHVMDLVRELESAEPDVPVIVMGDLNDFEETPPIRTFVEAGMIDLHDRVPSENDYSYIFNGVSQNLDYVFVPPALKDSVIDFGPVHFNTDFGAPPEGEIDHPSPRVSDHDPLLLRLREPGQPHFTIWMPLTLDNAPREAVGGAKPAPPATATSPPSPTIVPSPTPDEPTPEPGPGVPRTPLKITELFYDGDEPRVEPDEYIEFENVTESALPLDGWQIISVRGNQRYLLPDDASINSGERCRVYTDLNEVVEPGIPCSFDWDFTASGIWANVGDHAEIRDPSGALIDNFCYGEHAGDC